MEDSTTAERKYTKVRALWAFGQEYSLA